MALGIPHGLRNPGILDICPGIPTCAWTLTRSHEVSKKWQDTQKQQTTLSHNMYVQINIHL